MAGTIVAIAAGVAGSWLGAFVCLTLFGASGAALLLMGARLTGDDVGIQIHRVHSQAAFQWDDVASVERGGGNLVFRLKNKARAVIPDVEFWSGKDKPMLLQLVAEQLQQRGIQPQVKVRALLQAGDRR